MSDDTALKAMANVTGREIKNLKRRIGVLEDLLESALTHHYTRDHNDAPRCVGCGTELHPIDQTKGRCFIDRERGAVLHRTNCWVRTYCAMSGRGEQGPQRP